MIGRRPLIAGLAAVSLAPAACAATPNSAPPSGVIAQVATRGAMVAVPAQPGEAVLLTERGREGFFVLREGAAPKLDSLQGLFVPAPRSRHWARLWDEVTGYPEWFGARGDDVTAASDNRAAIEACIKLCPVTQLGPLAYHVMDTLRINVSNRTVRGSGQSIEAPYDGGTRIISSNPRKDVIHIGGNGPDARPAIIRVQEITATWSVDLIPPSAGRESDAPAAFRVTHVLAAHLERCFALNPLVGFRFNGIINSRCIGFGVTRFKRYGGQDFLRGVWVQGRPRLFAGGNASLYLVDGNVTTNMALRGTLHRPMGVFADADFADLYIHGLETAHIAFPIVLDGAGGDFDGGHGDVHIRSLVLDQIIGDGVTVRNLNALAKVQIDGGYIQIVDSRERNKGLWFENGQGQITVSNLQITGENSSTTSIGIYAQNQPNIAIGDSVIVENIAFPVTIDKGCPRLSLACTINAGTLRARGHGAVTVEGASQSTLRPKVTGLQGVWTAGVELLSAGHDRVNIDPTMVDPASVSAGHKVVINGKPIPSSGHYAADGHRAAEGVGIVLTGIVA